MTNYMPTKILDWRSAFDRLEGAYSKATMRSYTTDVEAYETWCAQNGIPTLFPAQAAHLATFLEDQANTKAPSTIKRRVCALRLVHGLLELPDPTTHKDVRLALRRACRAKTMRPQQAKGLTRDYLDQFIASEPNTPWGLRSRAMFALGYELLTRRSELLALTVDELELRNDGTLRVLIRRSKSDQFGQGRISFTSTHTAGLV
jgi:site-specific recombinase XerD